MKENKITDAINYLDYDLIMEAGIKAPEKKSATILHLRLALASACAMLACVMLISLPFLKVDAPTGILPVPTPPTSSDIGLEGTPTDTPHTDVITPNDTTIAPTPTDDNPTPVRIIEHLTLDINPSIDFEIENGIVISCTGINEDSKNLLGRVNVNGLKVELALPIVLEKLIEHQYISPKNTSVLLLSAYGSEKSDVLLKLAEEIATGVMTQHKLTAYIISQKMNYNLTTKNFADIYGVSLGKMQYVLNILEKTENVSFDSISKMSNTPLYVLLGFDITHKLYDFIHITDGYNEFGEKILMVRDEKGQYTYIEWDKLSKSEQKEIYGFYKPSFAVVN